MIFGGKLLYSGISDNCMVPIIMAEGGEENPFSFKKFVEKKKKQTQSDEDDSDNDEAVQNVLPDVSHAQTRQREDRKGRLTFSDFSLCMSVID